MKGRLVGTPFGAASPTAIARMLLLVTDMAVTLAALCLVLAVFLVQMKAAFDSRLFTPFTLIEEAAYTYTSATNYLTYGFFNSGLLQDFSSSPDPLDHPYLYNHMPPGPDLLVAILLKVSGGSYLFTRLALSLCGLLGFGAYYLFCRRMLSRHGLMLAALPIVLLGVWPITQFMERQIYAPFMLLAFMPLVAFDRYAATGRRAWLAACCAIALLSSIYIEYSALAGVIFCWIFLFVARLLPIRLRELVLVLAMFAAGIGLHLLQNFLVLGPDIFFEELRLTLSNRLTGIPTQEQMSEFYRSIGVVHHGARAVEVHTILAQLRSNLQAPGVTAIILLAAAVLISQAARPGISKGGTGLKDLDIAGARGTAWLLARLALWIAGTVCAPILLFPAFAQEVNLRGFHANMLFLGIGMAAVLSLALRQVIAAIAEGAGHLHPLLASGYYRRLAARQLSSESGRLTLMHGVALAVMVLCALVAARATAAQLRDGGRLLLAQAFAPEPQWEPLDQITRFSGSLFMTNINVPVVGFLTRAPGFGVCSPSSVQPGGRLDIKQCKTALMRRRDYWEGQRPRYFYFFEEKSLFPGFADCLPQGTLTGQNRMAESCMEDLRRRLAGQYPVALSNRNVTVFDLGGKRSD